jgi:NADH dehydrogenase FAD-containing subunit
VDETYAVEGTEGRVFAVGDCSNSPTASASGYMAGISATNLAKNIALSRAGKPLKRLHSKPKPMALVSIGPKLGAAQIGSITFGSFFTRNLKGTDLVCSKTWKDMGAGKPPAA